MEILIVNFLVCRLKAFQKEITQKKLIYQNTSILSQSNIKTIVNSTAGWRKRRHSNVRQIENIDSSNILQGNLNLTEMVESDSFLLATRFGDSNDQLCFSNQFHRTKIRKNIRKRHYHINIPSTNIFYSPPCAKDCQKPINGMTNQNFVPPSTSYLDIPSSHSVNSHAPICKSRLYWFYPVKGDRAISSKNISFTSTTSRPQLTYDSNNCLLAFLIAVLSMLVLMFVLIIS